MPETHVNGTRYDYDVTPDHCPICHHGIEPSNISHNVIERDKNRGNVFQLLYKCPRRECQHAFIAS